MTERGTNLYVTNLDNSRNKVMFGIPQSVIETGIYQDIELMRFIRHQHLKKYNDAENNQPFTVFQKNLESETLSSILDEAGKILTFVRGEIQKIYPGHENRKLDNGDFWRFLIEFKNTREMGLEESHLKLKSNDYPFGPHVVIGHVDSRSILRVKAETLNQLNALFNKALEIL